LIDIFKQKYLKYFLLQSRGTIWDSSRNEEILIPCLTTVWFSFENIIEKRQDLSNSINHKKKKNNNSPKKNIRMNFDAKHNSPHVRLIPNDIKPSTLYYKEVKRKISENVKDNVHFGTCYIDIWALSYYCCSDWVGCLALQNISKSELMKQANDEINGHDSDII